MHITQPPLTIDDYTNREPFTYNWPSPFVTFSKNKKNQNTQHILNPKPILGTQIHTSKRNKKI